MKKKKSALERAAHLYQLAQATALLRAVASVTPPGASLEEIPSHVIDRAIANLAHTPDGKILPSDKDFEEVRRKYV